MGKSKSLNPADAERKKARLREIKKNKANRTAQRAEKLFSSPEALRAEIDKWRRLRPGQIGEDGEKLDPASIANRIKKLEESLATLLRQRREEAEAAKKAEACRPKVTHAVPLFALEDGAAGGGGGEEGRRPEDSVYWHPQLNPYGAPPPGKPQKWRTLGTAAAHQAGAGGQLALPAPELPPPPPPLPPLPPPPPPPPKPKPLAVPVPPPPPPPPKPKPAEAAPAPPPAADGTAAMDAEEVEPPAAASAPPPPSDAPAAPAAAPLPPPEGPPPGVAPLPPPPGPPPHLRPLPPPAGPPPAYAAAMAAMARGHMAGMPVMPPAMGTIATMAMVAPLPSMLPPPHMHMPPPLPPHLYRPVAPLLSAPPGMAPPPRPAPPPLPGGASCPLLPFESAAPLPRESATVSGAATVRVYARAETNRELTALVPASVRVRRENAAPKGPRVAPLSAGVRDALPPAAAGAPGADGAYLSFLEDMAELGAV